MKEVLALGAGMILMFIGFIMCAYYITTYELVNEVKLIRGEEFEVSEGHTYNCQPTEKTKKILELKKELELLKGAI